MMAMMARFGGSSVDIVRYKNLLTYLLTSLKDGVPASVRLSAHVDEQQVPVQWQPADTEHDDDSKEHARRVRRSAPLSCRSSG